MHGRAEIGDDDAALVRLARRLREKYAGTAPARSDDELLRDLHAEQRVVVSVLPEQVVTWAGE